MAERLRIEELSRQPLVVGTSSFTDPSGTVGFKTDQVQVSALVRIAAALEAQTPAAWREVAHELPPVNTWVLVTTNPRWEPVPVMTAGLCPDGSWCDYDGTQVQPPLSWQYLPAPGPRPAAEKGGQQV